MDIGLHYGAGQVVVQIPQENIAQVIRPRHVGVSGQSNADIVKRAIAETVSEFSENIRGQAVGVLLPDGTRDLPLDAIFPPLFPLFTNAQKIIFFICTGTHNGDTPENQKIIDRIQTEAKKAAIGAYDIISHDCRESDFISAGTTRRVTKIFYHARLQEPAVFLALSDVKHHYFAGYSNPVKNFVPGLCAFKTTQQNHSWTMDDRSCAGVHPWHPDPALRNNPLAQDQCEAMTAIVQNHPVWAIVTLSSEGRIQWVDFGLARQVTAQAFLKADEWNCFSVEPVRKMIVSPGGLPNDVDLYIAQRALELTAGVVADGGEILFLSACPNGVGSLRTKKQFYDKLICPLEEIEACDQKEYQLFSHKPWRFSRLIRRLNRLRLYSQIDASEVEQMHMMYCPDPQVAIDEWLRQNPQEKILIVDGANKLLLRRGS
ncbi:MAG: DUF2088 domain-containing protein [Phycisphaerae bacterium]|nr:DUF2088 domain-containing protein [Phycisphaerae bacterium]